MQRPSILEETALDCVFDDFFHNSFSTSSGIGTVSSMRTDISETADSYRIDMELPGFSKEDIRAELCDGYLIVRASQKDSDSTQERHFIKKERYWGHYQRSFYVGKRITEKDIIAIFKNGILTLEFPKHERKVTIEGSNLIKIEG